MDIEVIMKPMTKYEMATMPPQSRHFRCESFNSLISIFKTAIEAIIPKPKEKNAITPNGIEIRLVILNIDNTI